MNIFNTVFIAMLWIIPTASVDQNNITAESGQNITLTCRAPDDKNNVVEWSRADLETKQVLVYQDEHLVSDDQHPSFKNRVDLQDRQMKDGDVSLILKNVTTTDGGTYECRVLMEQSSSPELICIVYLRVVPPPGPGGGTTEDGGKKDGRKEDGGKEDRSAGIVSLCLIFLGGFIIIATKLYLTWSSIKQKFETTFKAGRPARSSVIDI
ncbi:uncharacterized protein LOC115778043 [Archocentrus centrarchus]|uniref:uncharacterized protein LOC115778043 n=1 Tax=Archocentrus centrarchus TaxID=63155 RepID=UPI0011EA333F|nr:uncharacterized protein LOC115778043 [Archocentrus centrarchus]